MSVGQVIVTFLFEIIHKIIKRLKISVQYLHTPNVYNQMWKEDHTR